MNIAFVIVDRETTPRDRNWCITMSWALPLLQNLVPASIFESINLCQPDPTADPAEAGKYGIAIRDGSTGKVKIRHQFPGIRRINHKKTKHHLSQGLSVQYGKLLVDITVGPDDHEVTAHFADGTQETGTVIVGADGGVSRVRRWLLGDEAAQEVLPCQFMNFSFSLAAESAEWLDKRLGPTIEVAAHPRNMYMGLSLLDKPDAKPDSWLFYILAAWKPSDSTDGQGSASLLSDLRKRMYDWADPFKTVVEKLPDDIFIRQDQLRIWHTKAWDNRQGRVTLVGDAAHSMTFHRGQGGNLAIKDAYELFNKLVSIHNEESDQKTAIDTYDKGALLRGEEVEISRQCTMAFMDYENMEKSPLYQIGINPAMNH
ncbi:Monooxygenase, FAD-binding [Penicillium occitanis (nom. inval.)]|nr:Monooxygenase, FAD-binding [Penicillium occitanis (nom. inval.)]PCG99820.1 hypothetical protein PENOC_056170 [Penicillium occitanis (nom. inval.)]